MKKLNIFTPKIFLVKFFLPVLFMLAVKPAAAQLIYIPDSAFAVFLQTEVPAAMVYADSLNPNDPSVASTTFLNCDEWGINDLTGISAFVNLQWFNCGDNYGLTTIPFVSNSVTTFEVGGCTNLTTLTNIPSGVTTFDCSYCSLTSLPPLPAGLQVLNAMVNQLASLPSLPAGLLGLMLQDNQLTSLPALPATLTSLNCAYNLLTSLPTLPAPLGSLNCQGNYSLVMPSLSSTSITDLNIAETPGNSFPALPPGLQSLYCIFMQPPLTSLPSLPQSLIYLYCLGNNLTSLPLLPPGLIELDCRNNNIMYVTQPIPALLDYLGLHNNPIPCIPQLPDNGFLSYFSTDGSDCLFNKPLSCNDCQSFNLCTPAYSCNNMSFVNGTVFNDINMNGTLNNGEPGRQHINLFSNNGNFATECDLNGIYYLPSDTGISFVVNAQLLPYRVLSSTPPNHFFSNYGVIDSLDNIGIYDLPNVNDLVVSLTTYPGILPGFDYHLILTLDNFGTTVQSGQVYLVKPSMMNFVSATPAQSSLSGDTIFWNFTNMQPLGATAYFDALLSAPASAVLGTIVTSYAGVTAAANDTTPGNNFAFDEEMIVGALDPNDKRAEPAAGLTLAQIANGDYMTYTVRFQNTGTAPAVNVVIADTLSSTLDLTAFNIVSASHAYTWKIENRVLYVRFENIMLPDSNSNEPQSHGFIKYRVKPNSSLQVGNVMSNTAYIYFDFNSPVQTNTTNTLVLPVGFADFTSADGAYSVFPNPAHNNLIIRFKDLQAGTHALVSVFDLWGRVVLSAGKNGGTDVQLNLNSISAGIYFLQVELNGKVYQDRFVKD